MQEGFARAETYNPVLDAVKAANIKLTDEEVSSLEKVADSLELNVIRYRRKGRKLWKDELIFQVSGLQRSEACFA